MNSPRDFFETMVKPSYWDWRAEPLAQHRAKATEAEAFTGCLSQVLPTLEPYTEEAQRKAVYSCALALGVPWRQLFEEAGGDPLLIETVEAFWRLCDTGEMRGPNCERR